MASGADEGLRMLHEAFADSDPYTVAIIDFLMPVKTGMELAQKIAEDPALKSTKLVMITACVTGGPLNKPSR